MICLIKKTSIRDIQLVKFSLLSLFIRLMGGELVYNKFDEFNENLKKILSLIKKINY